MYTDVGSDTVAARSEHARVLEPLRGGDRLVRRYRWYTTSTPATSAWSRLISMPASPAIRVRFAPALFDCRANSTNSVGGSPPLAAYITIETSNNAHIRAIGDSRMLLGGSTGVSG